MTKEDLRTKYERIHFEESDTPSGNIKQCYANWIEKELIKQLILSGVVSTLKCDCGNTEDVKNIPICASCYNPHTGEW
tara:strand:- start:2337 stop:2570 length:234 start_codon:yes stop_codon:yes gene_type:complete